MQQFRPWRYRPVFPGAVYPVDRIARYTRGVTTFNIEDWTPALGLEGYDPLLWLRADQGLTTGGARQFYATDKTSLRHTDSAFFSMGDIDFVIAGWVWFDALGDQYFANKDTGAVREYGLRNDSGNNLSFSVFDSGGNDKTAESPATTITGKWYYVIGWHDATADTVNLQVDNGTVVSVSTAGFTINSTTTTAFFALGAYGALLCLDGKLSKFCLLKNSAARAVIDSADTRTEMYNLGRGILSGNLDLLLADLGTFVAGTDWDAWNLNETDGTADARSFSGLNDLTPTFGELITNGGFETAGGGGADIWGSWSENTGGTGSLADEGTIVDAGSHAMHITGDGGPTNLAYVTQSILTAGHRYFVSLRARYNTSGAIGVQVGNGNYTILTLTGSYATYTFSSTAANTVFLISTFQASAPDCYVDTVSVTAVDIPAADGPSSDIAPDTGSAGTNHGQLIGFADSETARSTDVPSAIGAGTSLSFDGVDDYVKCGSIGSVTAISLYVKLLIDNQEILTLTNSTTTAVTVAAGVLTFGASLTASAITVDGVSVSAADAGATLNDNAWHLLAFSLTSISATDCRLGTDGSNFGQIMLDDVKFNAGTLAYYTFDEETSLSLSDGDPIAAWQSIDASRHQFIQATASKRPVYRASAINSQPGVDFDGVDDLLVKASAFLTGTSGTVVVVARLDAIQNTEVAIASSDEGSTNRVLLLSFVQSTGNRKLNTYWANGGTADDLTGNEVSAIDTDYVVSTGSNSSTTTIRRNGVVQTLAVAGGNNGNWFDDATSKDNVTVGGWKSTSEGGFFNGKICEIQVWPHNFGAESISREVSYMLARYGITF